MSPLLGGLCGFVLLCFLAGDHQMQIPKDVQTSLLSGIELENGLLRGIFLLVLVFAAVGAHTPC